MSSDFSGVVGNYRGIYRGRRGPIKEYSSCFGRGSYAATGFNVLWPRVPTAKRKSEYQRVCGVGFTNCLSQILTLLVQLHTSKYMKSIINYRNLLSPPKIKQRHHKLVIPTTILEFQIDRKNTHRHYWPPVLRCLMPFKLFKAKGLRSLRLGISGCYLVGPAYCGCYTEWLTFGGLSKLWSLFGSPKLGPVLGPVL